jgi:NodT family efflux transporter outer membrane factor (OMF) lipoprotein
MESAAVTAMRYLAPALLVLAGCAVGPNFHTPPAPVASGYTPAPLVGTSATPNVHGGEAQKFDSTVDITGDWWTLFHSQPLNDLVDRALKNSPDIKAAQSALTAANEQVWAKRGAYYPSVTGTFNVSRNKTSNQIAPVPNSNQFYYSLFTPQVNVSFVPDVFGLNRRSVESLKAQAGVARFQLIATHITLSSNVVEAAIQEASLRAQIDATRQLLTVNTNMVNILRNQFAKGYASRLDLAAQESQLAQVEATLPPLLKQLAQQRDLLVALSGAYPDKELPETFELSSFQLPQELPVTLPSQLVEQRPDVRQAEENLHSASAQVGVAVANRLPQFTLSGFYGTQSITSNNIFGPGSSAWSLAAGLLQPIFSGGTLLHQQKAAEALYRQAAEQYQSTVVTAFQNVADCLNALLQDAEALKAASVAADAAKVTLDLSQRQLQVGYTSYLTLLNAEQTYQQAVINLAQAQANRYSDTAALFQALGGGWWHRQDLTEDY